MVPRELTVEQVEFALTWAPEDAQVDGNCSAVDPETDAAVLASIREQLGAGNQWAWCLVKLTASWNGFEGAAYLGCCSYGSEAEFRAGGYYDMQAEALADLNRVVQDCGARLAALAD